MDGDIVAVQVISEEELGSLNQLDTYDPLDPNPLETLLPETTRAPSVVGESNDESKDKIYGRVIGIIRRRWKKYCGSLDQVSCCLRKFIIIYALRILCNELS